MVAADSTASGRKISPGKFTNLFDDSNVLSSSREAFDKSLL
jgi:hypothetical protein